MSYEVGYSKHKKQPFIRNVDMASPYDIWYLTDLRHLENLLDALNDLRDSLQENPILFKVKET